MVLLPPLRLSGLFRSFRVRGGGVSDAVNIGIDRVAVDLRVDVHADGILGGGRHGAHPDDDERVATPGHRGRMMVLAKRTTDAARARESIRAHFRRIAGWSDATTDGIVRPIGTWHMGGVGWVPWAVPLSGLAAGWSATTSRTRTGDSCSNEVHIGLYPPV